MKDQNQDRRKELLEAMRELPERDQSAIGWLAENYDYAVRICKAGALTEQQRKSMMDQAIEKDEPLMIALLCMERRLNR